nr:non-ribosomal peptide synthetase [Pseudofrankia saprophytica]
MPPLAADEVDANVLERFHLVARQCADEVVLRSHRGTLTFGEIDRWSDDLANRLLDRSKTTTDASRPVALLFGHDPAAVVAMIGILKAGRPFVPLDGHLPAERMARILELAGADLCVCAGPSAGPVVGGTGGLADESDATLDLAGLLPPWVEPFPVGERPGTGYEPRRASTLDGLGLDGLDGLDGLGLDRLDGPDPAAAARPAVRAPRREGRDPAMLIFTSGSTGVPKGVVWNHSTFLFHHQVFQHAVDFGPDDRQVLLLPYSFISGMSIIFRTLLAGATLSMYDPRVRGLRDLPAWLSEERPTLLCATPSLLRGVVGAFSPGEVLDGLRYAQTVGEALYARDVRLLRPLLPADARIITTYGSSESGLTTLGLIARDDEVPDGGVVPAGRVLPGKEVRLLREDRSPVAPLGTEAGPGEAGEIMIYCPYLSGGYWRDEEQTATRFGVDENGVAYYRTGDMGRFGPDGQLRITGRLDGMVKIRGYLVEPIEVESTLLAAREVADAVVVADKNADPPRLVAYVVPSPDSLPSAAAIRRLLRSRLPSYMVPATIVTLSVLPRTERGKVDRMALPPAPPALAGDPPRNDWEEAVASIWARVLNLDTVGIHDDFTELGGDSLAAQDVAARLASELGVRLPTSALAQAPTVAELTAFVSRSSADADTLRHPDVMPLRTGGAGTPLFCFAGAGGLAIAMLSLAANFSGERPVYGLQAHGLERRGVPDWSVRAIARRHARHIRLLQPAGPYLLLGHSFGGLVAFEAAHQLRAAGEEVALLTIVDSAPPGRMRLSRGGALVPSKRHTPGAGEWAGPVFDGSPSHQPREGTRGPADALRVVADRAGQFARLPLTGVVRFPGMRQYDVFFNQGRILTMTYRPRPWTGRALLWQASNEVIDGGLRPVEGLWAPLLTGQDAVARTVLGNHDNVLREPLIGQLADDIRERLAQIDGVS